MEMIFQEVLFTQSGYDIHYSELQNVNFIIY